MTDNLKSKDASASNNLVQFEEDFNSRTKKLRWGPDGYLRPDQFLDHLTVIINSQKNIVHDLILASFWYVLFWPNFLFLTQEARSLSHVSCLDVKGEHWHQDLLILQLNDLLI